MQERIVLKKILAWGLDVYREILQCMKEKPQQIYMISTAAEN